MIRILHCADLHLDSPFRSLGLSEGEVRRRELRGTFTSMMLYVKENAIDFCLMAGDLFDTETVTRETVRLLTEQMASVPSCRFIIAPGNHDPYTPASVWAKTALPENVFVFSSDEVDRFEFEEYGVDVYGYAFRSATCKTSPLTDLRPAHPERINLLVAHCDLNDPLSPYAPVRVAELEKCGMDYAALGHIHLSDGVKQAGQTWYAYAGCIEGRDFGECGHKGVLVGTLSKTDGILSAEFKGVRFSKRRYEVDTLSVDGCRTEEEIGKKLYRLLADQNYSTDTVLRVTLTGAIPPTLAIRPAVFAEAFSSRVYALSLVDQTRPLLETELLRADPTVRGELLRTLLPLLEGDDPAQAALAARALRYGLAALAGEEPTD